MRTSHVFHVTFCWATTFVTVLLSGEEFVNDAYHIVRAVFVCPGKLDSLLERADDVCTLCGLGEEYGTTATGTAADDDHWDLPALGDYHYNILKLFKKPVDHNHNKNFHLTKPTFCYTVQFQQEFESLRIREIFS
jgi:hypothetical protein